MHRKTSKLLRKLAESDPTLTHRGLKKYYYRLSQKERYKLKKDLEKQIKEQENVNR